MWYIANNNLNDNKIMIIATFGIFKQSYSEEAKCGETYTNFNINNISKYFP